MDIKIINRNKLKMIINMSDLEKNNLSISDFMSKPIQSHDFFINFLNLINKHFDYNNFKFETIFFKKSKIFIIIVTKKFIFNTNYRKLKIDSFFIVKFYNINDLCNFCNSISVSVNSSLFYFNNNYYLKISFSHLQDFKKIILCFNEFCISYKIQSRIKGNIKCIIKDNAIETCKKLV